MDIKDQILAQLDEVKSGLESKLSEQVKTTIQKAASEMKAAIETGNSEAITKALKDNVDPLNETLKSINAWKGEISEAYAKDREAIDKLVASYKEISREQKKEVKSFAEAFAEEIVKPEHVEGIKSVSKNRPYKFQLKSATNMLTSDHLTGSGQITYNGRQAIQPAQKINFRDLIPSTHSDTPLYVTYQESTTGNYTFTNQTEGSSKAQVDYVFANVQTVNQYLSGWLKFSKQMRYNLPWMQTTLPRLLLRDFYKQENANFFSTASAAATGNNAATETDDVKALIDFIAQQQAANFNASFALVNNLQLARFNKLAYANLKYPGIGGFATGADGQVSIAGVPVVAVPWVTNHKVLIIDSDYIERVEVESIGVEFFEQDDNNVQKNLITARIECLEALNVMLGNSVVYGDFGGNS